MGSGYLLALICIRAKFLHEPPTIKIGRSLDLEIHDTRLNSFFIIGIKDDWSQSWKGRNLRDPKDKLARSWILPFSTLISSRLPPPKSPIIPSKPGKALNTPKADRIASDSPDRILISRLNLLSSSSANSFPFAASRSAAVATT